jgi:hypothetical protein
VNPALTVALMNLQPVTEPGRMTWPTFLYLYVEEEDEQKKSAYVFFFAVLLSERKKIRTDEARNEERAVIKHK